MPVITASAFRLLPGSASTTTPMPSVTSPGTNPTHGGAASADRINGDDVAFMSRGSRDDREGASPGLGGPHTRCRVLEPGRRHFLLGQCRDVERMRARVVALVGGNPYLPCLANAPCGAAPVRE